VPFVLSAYDEPSFLLFGQFRLASAEGVQQGDPLGSLLFSAALSSILELPCCDFVAGYLNDVTLSGSVIDLAGEVILFQTVSAKIGL